MDIKGSITKEELRKELQKLYNKAVENGELGLALEILDRIAQP